MNADQVKADVIAKVTGNVPPDPTAGEPARVFYKNTSVREVDEAQSAPIVISLPVVEDGQVQAPPGNAEPSRTARKVVQIVFSSNAERDGDFFALCDDGTIWIGIPSLGGYTWAEVEGPPK